MTARRRAAPTLRSLDSNSAQGMVIRLQSSVFSWVVVCRQRHCDECLPYKETYQIPKRFTLS